MLAEEIFLKKVIFEIVKNSKLKCQIVYIWSNYESFCLKNEYYVKIISGRTHELTKKYFVIQGSKC